jgi:hypothetical protein
MARHEQDREDLMAEATALVERVELRIASEVEPIVLGVRSNGCLSIYFGADPALHFNTRGELRRGFIDGRLLTAEQGRLVLMTRKRQAGEVQLLRHELDAADTHAMLELLSARLLQLTTALREHSHEVLRQVPPESPLNTALWLGRIPVQLFVAQAPHAR